MCVVGVVVGGNVKFFVDRFVVIVVYWWFDEWFIVGVWVIGICM